MTILTTLSFVGNVVSFCSKFALFQRGKLGITLFLWVKMKVERVMGIEPTCQVKIEEAVLRQASGLKGVRLWHMASVREHILTQMDDSASFAPR